MNTTAAHQKDGYKADHRRQYPNKTEYVNSNLTPRGVRHMLTIPQVDDKIVVWGHQYFCMWYLIEQWNNTFFAQPKEKVMKKYKRLMNNYLGKDVITFDHIEALHDLGFLPITIRALPEGSVVDARVPVLIIENTHPDFFWMTNFLETVMSCMLWKPATSATTARKYRSLLNHWCNVTGGDINFVPFQGHDFSFRGMAGIQDAQMSSSGHALFFVGSDTIPVIDFLEDYYFADSDNELVVCSIPATEHSVMCLGGTGNKRKQPSLSSELNKIKKDAPSFAKWCSEIGTVGVTADGIYNSKPMTSNNVYFYVQVKDDEIIAVGEERGRDGGWTWFAENNDSEPAVIARQQIIKVPIDVDSFIANYEFSEHLHILPGMHKTADKKAYLMNIINDAEFQTFLRLITETYPSGPISIVSDTWDFWRVVTEYLPILKEVILARGDGPLDKLVIRPDSGDPADIICGTSETQGFTGPERGLIQCLHDIFGGDKNAKGFKNLDSHIGAIYGDSITLQRADDMCRRLWVRWFASTNIVFGIGSFTYEYVTRDSLGYAVKATAGVVDGEVVEVFKDPKTDDGLKKSAKGYLAINVNAYGDYVLEDQVERGTPDDTIEIFRDSKMITTVTLAEARARALDSI